MGIEKFKRRLLVDGTDVPQSGGGSGGSVPPTANTIAQRGADGSLRAATGEEDDSVVNELRLNEEINRLTSYVNDLTQPAGTETYGTVLRAAYVVELDESAELSDVVTTVNALIEALRTSGAMEPIG